VAKSPEPPAVPQLSETTVVAGSEEDTKTTTARPGVDRAYVVRMSPYRQAPQVVPPPKDAGSAAIWTLLALFVLLLAIALHDASANAPLLQAAHAVIGH
jgi:hypothetical protein